jgi:hypothetical protein
MLKYVMMIVVAAHVSATNNPAIMMMAEGAEDEIPFTSPKISPLDKTWTTRGQETEEGSEMLVFLALTSPVSFRAEGTGLEPATPLLGHHISSR